MIELLGITFHLYGLFIGLGVWLGFEAAVKACRGSFKRESLEIAFLWIVVPALTGARLYHVIDYWKRYYSHDLIKTFYVWEGGLGIWGGIVGGLMGLGIYSLIKKRNFIRLADALVVGAPLAQAIGRLGNWANGELYGKNGEPLFAYEAILNLILFNFLWKKASKKSNQGNMTGYYLIGYGIIRILLENLRSEDIIWKIAGIPTAILFGLISVVVGVWLIKNRGR